MPIIRILIGISLLTMGRRLFWLFVGGIGFIVGVEFATRFVHGPAWLIFAIALGTGLLGALLALFLQQLAIGVAGFLAGGYIATDVVMKLGWGTGHSFWPFLIGGIVGVFLMFFVFNWTLIVMSSLSGAAIVVNAVPLDLLTSKVIFVALLIFGIVVQTRILPRRSDGRGL